MQMLRENHILSFCKHYESVTFECSLNVLKQVVFKKKTDKFATKMFQKIIQ